LAEAAALDERLCVYPGFDHAPRFCGQVGRGDWTLCPEASGLSLHFKWIAYSEEQFRKSDIILQALSACKI